VFKGFLDTEDNKKPAMSHTTTLLRSRRGGGGYSGNGSSSKGNKLATLPLHTSSGTPAASRVFAARSKTQRGRTVIFASISLVLVGLVGGSLYQLRNVDGSPSDRSSSGRTLLDSAALDYQALGVDGPIHDIVIAGCGPAGLTAALFGARSGLDVVVLGSETGLLSETQHLDNFPSYTEGNGPTWLKATKQQAIQFGANFATPGVLATELERIPVATEKNEGSLFTLTTTSSHSREQKIHAWSVIVASGAAPRHLGLPKEDLLWGRTLHNCAICDGHLYLDKTVLVVGGGDSAMDAAILLARYAKQVYLVHRRTQLSGKNQAAVDVAQSTPNIQMLLPYAVEQWELNSENQLTGARIQNTKKTGDTQNLSIDGAFVMIGATPNTEWLKNTIRLDDEGLVQLEGATQASVSGIFAVGEVSDNIYKQAITASAAGAQAAIDAERWLRETHGVHKHVNTPHTPNVLEPKTSKKKETKDEEERILQDSDSDCDLTEENCITRIVNSHPVVVFSKSWCPYCRRALEALNAAGVPEPYIIDLSNNPKTREIQGTLKQMTKRRTVPNVFVGGKSIGGGDETAALQAQGGLVPLLVEAGALKKSSTSTDDTEGKGEACNLKEQSCIEEIIQKYPIVMFSLEWCPECKRTLELLRNIGAKIPHIIDLDDYKAISQDIRYHMMNRDGRRSVPNLYIGGEFFGGFKQTSKLHEEGKLISKLKEVGWPLETA
jgi:thioredoxin reductase (NADPH)